MKFDYKTTQIDLKTLEKGIETAYSTKLEYIFKNREILKKISVVAYDSQFIYIWTTKKINDIKPFSNSLSKYQIYKIAHALNIDKQDRMGWWTGIWPQSLADYLPKELQKNYFENPIICGSFLGDFINIQKQNKIKNNPYITKESYLATIIHEFGHAYYQMHKNWWFSDKKKNLKLLRDSELLYEDENMKQEIKIEIPQPLLFSEIFAFCTEYSASKIFWIKHKKKMDQFAIETIHQNLKTEKQKNLDSEDSVFSDSNPYQTALVLGRIFLHKYPQTWPKTLITKTSI